MEGFSYKKKKGKETDFFSFPHFFQVMRGEMESNKNWNDRFKR